MTTFFLMGVKKSLLLAKQILLFWSQYLLLENLALMVEKNQKSHTCYLLLWLAHLLKLSGNVFYKINTKNLNMNLGYTCTIPKLNLYYKIGQNDCTIFLYFFKYLEETRNTLFCIKLSSYFHPKETSCKKYAQETENIF